MRDPNLIDSAGKAWRSNDLDAEMLDMWFINLPEFHPMLQWFVVCEWHNTSSNVFSVLVYALDPESYLFKDVDPDIFRHQEIKFLPLEIVKHDLPVISRRIHAQLIEAFVQEIIAGRLKPDEDCKQDLSNYLINAERWLSK